MNRTPAAGDVFVGLDLGTSGLKAVALGADGDVIARADARYPTESPAAGAYEQDPRAWARACIEALATVSAAVGESGSIRALGLSAMIPTLVVADRQARPLAPAITWQDSRAESHGARLSDGAGADEIYRLTGQWLDGRYLLPMYLGLLSRTDQHGEIALLLGAKDWLLAWLTSEVATDPSTATGVGAYRLDTGQWHQPLLDLAADLSGAPLPALPPVVPSETAFPLRREVARECGLPAGIPVCVGGADSVLGAFGLGAAPGDVAYIAGTSTAIIGIADDWGPDPMHRYIGTPLAGMEGIGMEMDLLATGSSARWLAGLLRLDDENELADLAADVPVDEAPTFLPYLAPGEQGALWDPRLTGAVSGLSLSTKPSHMARGLLTGIVVESKRCLEILQEQDINGPVLVAGGASNDPRFRTELADACHRVVHAPAQGGTDYSAAGAARIAAIAVGERIARPPSEQEQIHPDPGRREMWDRVCARHDAIRLALNPLTSEESP